jgi:hypothetical protein
MKALILLAVVILMAGCAKNESGSSNVSTNQSEATRTKTTDTKTTAVADPNSPPVEFTFLGITPDKQNIAYRFKVNTAKPIEEVHLALKEMDASGKALENTTLIWQNIVHSTQQPIESGQTYEDKSYVDPKATKVECVLKEVVFKDNTRWSPK